MVEYTTGIVLDKDTGKFRVYWRAGSRYIRSKDFLTSSPMEAVNQLLSYAYEMNPQDENSVISQDELTQGLYEGWEEAMLDTYRPRGSNKKASTLMKRQSGSLKY